MVNLYFSQRWENYLVLSKTESNFYAESSFYWSRRACVRHTWWRTKRSWPLFSPTFFFFSFSSPPSTFHPLRRISRAWKFVFPNILAFLGNFFCPRKKGHFRAIFRDGQRSVAEPGPTPSPWSISFFFFFSLLRLFLLTHFGEFPLCENLFPRIFWQI